MKLIKKLLALCAFGFLFAGTAQAQEAPPSVGELYTQFQTTCIIQAGGSNTYYFQCMGDSFIAAGDQAEQTGYDMIDFGSGPGYPEYYWMVALGIQWLQAAADYKAQGLDCYYWTNCGSVFG